MKRLLCLLLILMLAISVVACSKSEGDSKVTTTPKSTTAQGTTTTQEPEKNPFEEFFEITWFVQTNQTYTEERWDEKELEELFNVEIHVWPEDSGNTERTSMMIAAGEIADFFFMPGAPMDPYDMYENGLIRSITLQQMRDWIPGYVADLEKIPVGFLYHLVPGKTDEYIGFSHVNIGNCQYFYDAACINLDWLEAIGYGVDTSNLKSAYYDPEGEFAYFNNKIYFAHNLFTFEELNDILKKFTEEDPDGNGVDDTFGMLYMPESSSTNFVQEGLFGFVDDVTYLYKDPVTGDIVPKYAYTYYKDYLAWVSDMLQKGYMVRLPGERSWYDEYQELTRTNKYGIMGINGGGYYSLTSDSYRVLPPQNIILDTDKTARFIVGPLLNGPNGRAGSRTYGLDPYSPAGSWRLQMIGGQVSDPKLQRICAILQYTTFDGNGIYKSRYYRGIEGIHYTWEGEPEWSLMKTVPLDQQPAEYKFFGNKYTFFLWNFPSTIKESVEKAKRTGQWSFMTYVHDNNLFQYYAIDPLKQTSEAYMGRALWNAYREDKSEVDPQLNPIINDFKTRVLNGEIANINTEWNQYIDQLYANGLQMLIDKYFNNPEFVEYDPGQKYTMVE
ncbi:MAG: hypothetical protein GX082_05365 [Clostridiaceae bacterium]|nr:hypothetical protein [Clostridiaceae bacterium]